MNRDYKGFDVGAVPFYISSQFSGEKKRGKPLNRTTRRLVMLFDGNGCLVIGGTLYFAFHDKSATNDGNERRACRGEVAQGSRLAHRRASLPKWPPRHRSGRSARRARFQSDCRVRRSEDARRRFLWRTDRCRELAEAA